MPTTASPAVSSTVGLKNVVLAPLTVDTEETITYGTLQAVAGANQHPQVLQGRSNLSCQWQDYNRG